jgi:amino-acid N-acetyltransferase
MKLEKARINDANAVHKLINSFADKDEMLPRALSEIYENIREIFVVREEGKVVACAALHVNWCDLAEIRSLAVESALQNKDAGSMLVRACLDEARELGLPAVFCLTYKPAFFEKLGFTLIDKSELPRKIWAECFRCPKFPDCDEVSLVYRF